MSCKGAAVSAFTTAVDILPPDEVVRLADQYRRIYARHLFARVPVHMTLACPFVPFDQLRNADDILKSVATQAAPFVVRIAGSGWLSDPSRLVLFVEPDEPVRDLQLLLLARFPGAGAEGLPGNPVRPHITLGYLDDQAALRRLAAEVDAQAHGMTFHVDAMHVTYGNETCVWRRACTYALGGHAP